LFIQAIHKTGIVCRYNIDISLKVKSFLTFNVLFSVFSLISLNLFCPKESISFFEFFLNIFSKISFFNQIFINLSTFSESKAFFICSKVLFFIHNSCCLSSVKLSSSLNFKSFIFSKIPFLLSFQVISFQDRFISIFIHIE